MVHPRQGFSLGPGTQRPYGAEPQTDNPQRICHVDRTEIVTAVRPSESCDALSICHEDTHPSVGGLENESEGLKLDHRHESKLDYRLLEGRYQISPDSEPQLSDQLSSLPKTILILLLKVLHFGKSLSTGQTRSGSHLNHSLERSLGHGLIIQQIFVG